MSILAKISFFITRRGKQFICWCFFCRAFIVFEDIIQLFPNEVSVIFWYVLFFMCSSSLMNWLLIYHPSILVSPSTSVAKKLLERRNSNEKCWAANYAQPSLWKMLLNQASTSPSYPETNLKLWKCLKNFSSQPLTCFTNLFC